MFKRGKSSVLLAVELVEGKVICAARCGACRGESHLYVLAVELVEGTEFCAC